jgi:hypothetical protein
MKPEGLEKNEFRDLFFIQEPSGKQAGKVGRFIDESMFVTIVDSVWPAEKFAEAVGRMESGKARGKVIM